MAPTLSYRNRILALSRLSAYLCFALILSYVEAILPIGALVPLPWIKPGLANIVVILCFFDESPLGALAVSVCRILLSGILFGNPSSLLFSLAGGLLSYAVVFTAALIFKDKVSFIGICVLSATAHNIGQFILSVIYIGSTAAISLLPLLIISGVLCGTVTGVILCILPKKVFFKRMLKETDEKC